jgi:cell division protease FtsH
VFTLQARVALSDVLELLEAAEAKAAYGLAINWKPLQALVAALLERGVLQVRQQLQQACMYGLQCRR